MRARYRYAIESGRFDVFKNSEASDGAESKIAEMTNGQTFGELALLYGAKRSATVRVRFERKSTPEMAWRVWDPSCEVQPMGIVFRRVSM